MTGNRPQQATELLELLAIPEVGDRVYEIADGELRAAYGRLLSRLVAVRDGEGQ